MTKQHTFSIDLKNLKSRKNKPSDDVELKQIDSIADEQGFVSREPAAFTPKRRGRPPSARTGQVHAKVLPHVSDEISQEANRRGCTQGVIIEEAWQLYKEKTADQ